MYLLDHFISARVTPFQLPPAMDVHRVLKLLLQSLASRTLPQQFTLDVIQLAPKVTLE